MKNLAVKKDFLIFYSVCMFVCVFVGNRLFKLKLKKKTSGKKGFLSFYSVCMFVCVFVCLCVC